MTDLITNNAHEEWLLLQKQCHSFLLSGFLPDHITRGVPKEVAMAKALTIVMKGKELGVPPLQAFSSITVIQGKPCLSSELMLALVYQRVKGAKVTFRTPPEMQSKECVVEMQRPGGEPQLFRFGMDDAHAAGLIKPNSAWQKYPSAMLRARAISAGARAVFPDCIMGCYTPEELGGDIVDITPEGETVIQSPPPPPKPINKAVEEVSKVIDEPKDLGEIVCEFGNKFKGMKIKDIHPKDLGSYAAWILDQPKPSPDFRRFAESAVEYLEEKMAEEANKHNDEVFPFEEGK